MLHTSEHPTRGFKSSEKKLVTSSEAQKIYELAQKESILMRATGAAAVSVRSLIADRYGQQPPQSKQELEDFKVEIDDTAVKALSDELHNQSLYCFHTVGSEGDKEAQYQGIAAPSLKNGKFGHHDNHRLDKVSDAVEGTTAAAENKAGAVSVVAISNEGGLLPSQDGVFYMEKVFGPPELVGHVSLHQTPEEMLLTACEVLDILPSELSVVILKRDRNQPHLDAARRLGVQLFEIKAGDFMPSLLAVTHHSENPFMVMGIGGYEEGVVAAAAAKAVGGLAEGRVWPSAEAAIHQPVLGINELVPGDQQETMVVVSAITKDLWFDLPETEVISKSSGNVTSLTVSHRGVMINRHEVVCRPTYNHA